MNNQSQTLLHPAESTYITHITEYTHTDTHTQTLRDSHHKKSDSYGRGGDWYMMTAVQTPHAHHGIYWATTFLVVAKTNIS